jgi:hypothetical protein
MTHEEGGYYTVGGKIVVCEFSLKSGDLLPN